MENKIFWRHAEAVWCGRDHERRLSDRGWRQARRSAEWLRSRGVAFPVFCSQALRGQETAGCYHAAPTQLAGLDPGQSAATVFAALQALDGRDAVIVGHLPWIGEVVATLLAKQGGYLPVNYSEVFWLVCEDDEKWRLEARYNG